MISMPQFTRRAHAALKVRPTRLAMGLGLCLLIAGCAPTAPVVEVKIKPVEGAASAGGEAANSTETATESGYGDLTGTVTFKGDFTEPAAIIRMGDGSVKDAAVCSAESIPDEGLIVDPSSKGIANVLIYMDKKPANIKADLLEIPKEPLVFDQKGCKFFPHVLPLRVGQELLVKSEDAIAHNTHTFPVRNDPFNKVIKAGDREGVPCNYTKSENGPLEVKCDLHTWMRAYHFPIDHPYFALTGKDGKFTIPGIPAGKHVFKVWQEKGPGDAHLLERKLEITIKADTPTTHDLSYDGAKFAALPRPATRVVAYSRLQRGGEINLTQAEGQQP